MSYSLRKEDCCPITITEEEYVAFLALAKENRAKQIAKNIKELSDLIGAGETKMIVRAYLSELSD